MKPLLQHENGYDYLEVGNGPCLLLLHGLFGALSNWDRVLQDFSTQYRVVIPLLPIYSGARTTPSVEGLAEFVVGFADTLALHQFTLIGNSLGGHVALMLALAHPQRVQSLVLTGSSGLFENGMGSTFPRRGDYSYVKAKVEYTFYSPTTATKELVDEVYGHVNDRSAAMRILKIARAAQRLNMARELRRLSVRTCLIWGLNDNITPPTVAHEFRRLIPRSELHFIDHCGHAAMMEQPDRFNALVREFMAQKVPVPQ